MAPHRPLDAPSLAACRQTLAYLDYYSIFALDV